MKTITYDAFNWFRIEKFAPIWIKAITYNKTIQTLEGIITATKGDILCKGIEGELWAQKKEDLDRCYKPTGKVEDGWEEYKPDDSSNCQLWAAELLQEVEIDTRFGKLKGKIGDFVLKETASDSEIPLRYWIVNQKIFEKTYRKLY